MIDAMKQALEALKRLNDIDGVYSWESTEQALRQAIEQAEKPPIYVERATTDYEDGWEEGFKAGAQKEKESTSSNVDPRVPLNSNVNITKNIENRLCDIERQDEREACAKLCEELKWNASQFDCAAAIRGRI